MIDSWKILDLLLSHAAVHKPGDHTRYQWYFIQPEGDAGFYILARTDRSTGKWVVSDFSRDPEARR